MSMSKSYNITFSLEMPFFLALLLVLPGLSSGQTGGNPIRPDSHCIWYGNAGVDPEYPDSV